MYIQFPLLLGDLLEQGSYLYYTRETIALKLQIREKTFS